MGCCNESDAPEFQFEMEDGSEVPRHTYQCRDFEVVATRANIHSIYYEGVDVVTFILRKREDGNT